MIIAVNLLCLIKLYQRMYVEGKKNIVYIQFSTIRVFGHPRGGGPGM